MRDATAIFELKETSNRLRYVFWAGALALLYLVAVRLTSPEIDRRLTARTPDRPDARPPSR
jgi:hypothetical protein